ncbi:hypothetical protein [Enhygromyxa salina]|uniref:Uncharacterized protein n=1 Tax=Enhygromyxa salina TaxID=215803 RepID=A0A2S9XTG5_9BACT|nr:hypothetical protein [Enhygromyxa salina]PRP96133.1 hypothetical protein ENSA7_69470 [Enhygromyxa salina]
MNARIQRSSECIVGDDPIPIDRCVVAEDYLTERSLGVLDYNVGFGWGSPTISFPPMCAVVSCDTGSAVAVAMAAAAPHRPTPTSHRTQARTPAAPTAVTVGSPGGPGGVSFPPLPPIMFP